MVAFTAVTRAYFAFPHHSRWGLALYVESRAGRLARLNIKQFSVKAAAALLTGLEAHGIKVEVPDSWFAQYVVGQMRSEQAKLR